MAPNNQVLMSSHRGAGTSLSGGGILSRMGQQPRGQTSEMRNDRAKAILLQGGSHNLNENILFEITPSVSSILGRMMERLRAATSSCLGILQRNFTLATQ